MNAAKYVPIDVIASFRKVIEETNYNTTIKLACDDTDTDKADS